MIVSELCSNGDLFDYIRNVPMPSLYKVVRLCFLSLLVYLEGSFIAKHHARYCLWIGIPSHPQAFDYPPGLQILKYPDYLSRRCKDCGFWTSKGQAIDAIDGSECCRHGELASTGALARPSQVQSQSRCVFLCNGFLGDAPVAFSD